MKRLCIILSILLLSAASAQAQKKRLPANTLADNTHVLLILDCSSSMWDKWQSDSKIKVTQAVLLKFMDSISHQNNVEFAMRVFGHMNKNDRGTRLEVPFAYDNNYKIKSKIKTLVPQGGCSATTALSNALNDFPTVNSSRNIILIITDGLDDCGDDICESARQVQTSGIVVKTFIIGIGKKSNFKRDLSCAGKFFHVPNEENYIKTLYTIFDLANQQAGVCLSITDNSGKAYESTTPVTFADAQTGMPRLQTLYTRNSKTLPDTINADPLIDYNVTFHTNPPQTLHGIRLENGRTNNINLTAEQGLLRVHFDGHRVLFQIPEYTVTVRRSSDNSYVNAGPLNHETPFITGRYNIEVNTLPTTIMQQVDIKYSATTELVIPTPGMAVVNKPKGFFKGLIFAIGEEDNRLSQIYTLDEEKNVERLVMMPGEYVVLLQELEEQGHKTVQKRRFKIESAQQTNINF